MDQGLRRRRRRWVPVWGWAPLAVGVLGVLAVGDTCLHNGALAHQLLDEDVDSGGGVFKSGLSVSNHIDYKIVGGTYATTSLTDHPDGRQLRPAGVHCLCGPCHCRCGLLFRDRTRARRCRVHRYSRIMRATC